MCVSLTPRPYPHLVVVLSLRPHRTTTGALSEPWEAAATEGLTWDLVTVIRFHTVKFKVTAECDARWDEHVWCAIRLLQEEEVISKTWSAIGLLVVFGMGCVT